MDVKPSHLQAINLLSKPSFFLVREIVNNMTTRQRASCDETSFKKVKKNTSNEASLLRQMELCNDMELVFFRVKAIGNIKQSQHLEKFTNLLTNNF